MILKISYKKGDLFHNLTDKAIYLHACNSQKIWGAGVSIYFKKYFYKAYLEYKSKINNPGDGYIVNHDTYKIACLITSEHFGFRKDSPKKILVQTYVALQNMMNKISEKDITIYSPKINSGYFATPWEATEKVIIRACEKTDKNINWIVWEK
jgi:O-acetyl-ADP-ribose deacetylase (regulator of RNase III)